MKFFAIFAAIAAVAVASTDHSTWTLTELSAALESPDTNPALIPYLENALNQYMTSLFAGHQVEAITVVTPAGLFDTAPVAVAPVAVAPVLADKPEATAASSPLVQIIVNVAGNQQAAAPAPTPAVVPSPVVEAPIVRPEPVSVVEIAPEPVSVVEIAPAPVAVVPEAVNVPGTFNPIDILAPIVIAPAPAGGDIVGPIV